LGESDFERERMMNETSSIWGYLEMNRCIFPQTNFLIIFFIFILGGFSFLRISFLKVFQVTLLPLFFSLPSPPF